MRELTDDGGTGDAQVDEAVRTLETLDGLPVHEHAAVVERVHQVLQDRLTGEPDAEPDHDDVDDVQRDDDQRDDVQGDGGPAAPVGPVGGAARPSQEIRPGSDIRPGGRPGDWVRPGPGAGSDGGEG